MINNGQIITTTTGDKYRILSVNGDTVKVIEYSEGDLNAYPRIKTILIKNIIQ